MQKNMQNFAKYIYGIFFRIFPAYATSSDGES